MNHYQIFIVRKTRFHVFFNLYINGSKANTAGYICLETDIFERFFKDLFKSSRGNCIKTFSVNPPTEFYP